MLEKTYDAAAVEPQIARKWAEADAFRAGAGAKEGADPYTIVIPPPNVTGCCTWATRSTTRSRIS